jgi:hypothetical protein
MSQLVLISRNRANYNNHDSDKTQYSESLDGNSTHIEEPGGYNDGRVEAIEEVSKQEHERTCEGFQDDLDEEDSQEVQVD